MRQKLFLLAALLAVALLPAPAGAVVNDSHHDMSAYLTAGQTFTCYFCHGIRDTNTTDQGLGTVGNLCWNRCHSGGGIAGAGTGGLVPEAPRPGSLDGLGTQLAALPVGITVLNTSHGMALTVPAPDRNASITGSNFPHTNTFPTDALECTSCHNVHSNNYAPFLNRPMGDNDATFAATDTLCTTCHAGATAAPFLRYALITSVRAEQGGHVIEVALNAANAAARTGEGRHARQIALKGNTLDVASLSGTALNPNSAHYTTGGHLGDFAAANADPGTTGGNVGCYTCHSAHMPSGGNNQLLIIKENGVYNPIASGTGSDTAPLCITCHGLAASSPNPGTTAYYHPANGEAIVPYQHNVSYWGQTATMAIVINTTWTDPGALRGAAPNLAITCTTCHDVHPSAATGGQMAIRNLVASQATGEPVCIGCHAGAEGGGTVRNSHHLTGTLNYTASPYAYVNPSWAVAASGNANFGNLADGLQCQDCHVFNHTAHNW